MSSNEKVGRLLLNNQLFPPKYIPESADVVVVSDSMWLIDEKPFNKLTLVHRILSANLYADENDYDRTSGFLGNTRPLEDALKHLRAKKVKIIKLFDPLDKPLLQSVERLVKRNKMTLEVEDTPAFTETHEDLDQFLKEHPPKEKGGIRKYNHSTFYEWQRRRLKILWSSGDKPVGGKLSFDVENRDPFPPKMDKDPTVYKPNKSSSKLKEQILKVAEYVESKYPNNPGILFRKSSSDTDDLVERLTMYPLTNTEAKKRLGIFLKKMLPDFGKYEDAFQPGVSFGYHSVLSSSLNNGLLTPRDVLEAVQSLPGKTTRKHLPSLEGFVRQVFGWRAYCRLVYRQERQVMMRSNFLGHKRRLPATWFQYSGDDTKNKGKSISLTNIEWLDNLLLDAQERAYAHHIIRLMVFSNWFLLNQYHPQDVLKWFWSVVSIDAYEWVMVPNVLGMGQYADGGIMMMRPYVSAGAYLETMSGGKVKDEDGIWTALYYGFLMKHENKIGKMYAYARSMAYIRRSSPSKKKEWKAIVKNYWKGIGKKYVPTKEAKDEVDSDDDAKRDDAEGGDDDVSKKDERKDND